MKNIFTVRLAMEFLKKLGGLPARLSIILLVCLAIFTFLFGQLEVLSEYFEQKGDIKTALLLSPWPAVRVRDLGSRILVNEPDGEKFMESLSRVWGQDPGMNLWLGNKNYEKGEVARAVAFYEIAVDNNPIGNFGLYPKMGVFYRQQWRKHKRDRIYQFFARNLERAGTKENQSIAKTLYLIGQDYLQDGRQSKTLSWWRQAADWSPDWSYFYIEAASLAIEIKKVEVARAILDKCLIYEAPRAHCQDFKKRLTFGWDFTPPGYWQDKINEIPDY